jgi:predicted dehydrogenase
LVCQIFGEPFIVSNSKVVRTAVIGLGPRGRGFARMYHSQQHEGFDLKALCDLSPAVLDKLRETYGDTVSYYTDMNAMLAREDIDAVIVATNDPYHVDPTRRRCARLRACL